MVVPLRTLPPRLYHRAFLFLLNSKLYWFIIIFHLIIHACLMVFVLTELKIMLIKNYLDESLRTVPPRLHYRAFLYFLPWKFFIYFFYLEIIYFSYFEFIFSSSPNSAPSTLTQCVHFFFHLEFIFSFPYKFLFYFYFQFICFYFFNLSELCPLDSTTVRSFFSLFCFYFQLFFFSIFSLKLYWLSEWGACVSWHNWDLAPSILPLCVHFFHHDKMCFFFYLVKMFFLTLKKSVIFVTLWSMFLLPWINVFYFTLKKCVFFYLEKMIFFLPWKNNFFLTKMTLAVWEA